jgi:AcrR family transcriptional regulator
MSVDKDAKSARLSQAERTALSDSRMYEAAMELIAESGTHNTTLKDIGVRAGYSRGLASNRFGSKEALFSNLVTSFNAKWESELGRFVGRRTGISAVLAALDAVEYFLTNKSTYMKSMYILWYESISSRNELGIRLAENHAIYRDDVARWIRQGIEEGFIRPTVDPARMSFQFCAFIFGTIYQWLVSPEAVDVRTAFQDFRRTILETIAERRRGQQGDQDRI